jgi:hypothetical protein
MVYTEVIILSSKTAKKTTLVMLLDAFSKTYLSEEDTPFLYDMSRDGIVTHIEPLFAFKGIETSIFTGVWPSVHNVWTEFCFSDNQIERKNEVLFRKAIETIDLLPLGEAKSKCRYVVERFIFKKAHKTPHLIPPAAMKYFQPSQHKDITEPGAVGEIKTVFDVFRENGVQYFFTEPWIRGDAGVLRKAKKLLKQEHYFDFWYLKLNHLDHMGHKFGPSPSIFSQQLTKIDAYVKEMVTLLQKKNPHLNVLLFADHGMSEVSNGVNILAELSQLKPKMYKDYVPFADSTMVRFWFFTEEAKQEICEHLRQIKYGHVLSPAEKKHLKIPLDPKYGETIYAVDEGYVVHPCFFRSSSIAKGMHGYAYPKTPASLPIIIMNDAMAENCQISKQLTYADIAQLILHSLLPEISTGIPPSKEI